MERMRPPKDAPPRDLHQLLEKVLRRLSYGPLQQGPLTMFPRCLAVLRLLGIGKVRSGPILVLDA
jgi:hypothetical protein